VHDITLQLLYKRADKIHRANSNDLHNVVMWK